MNYLKDLLNKYKTEEISIEQILGELRQLPYKDIDFAKIDNHRQLRQGFPEVIFCPGKDNEQIVKILQELKKRNSIILATKATKANGDYVINKIPQANYHEKAQIITYGQFPEPETENYTLVISAGTADMAIAQEALVVLKAYGIKSEKLLDCGVSGIHRLFDNMDKILKASAIIVVAGMEGALPSVVGGIAACPILAVPTSVGYGANFQGVTALLGMLNSCVPNVSVVNIDNGFGAAHIAATIVKQSYTLK